jgi:HAD superfamily hydrolase (TIGR01662 family)
MKQSYCIIGATKDDIRVHYFRQALERKGISEVIFLPYQQIVQQDENILSTLPSNTILRIESPHRDFDAYRLFLAEGYHLIKNESECHIDISKITDLPFDKGRILYPRQWFLGFSSVLRRIHNCLLQRNDIIPLLLPKDIMLMFDKLECQKMLSKRGVKIPFLLGKIDNYAHLIDLMQEAGINRVFLKLRHGSAASGIVAFEKHNTKYKAISTVELVENHTGVHLYNSRKLQIYSKMDDIVKLVNELSKHQIYAEAWFPKMGVHGLTCDCRIVFINGQPKHTVIRSGKSPITNLHLGCTRNLPDELIEKIGISNWQSAINNCVRIEECFPNSLYWAIDMAFAPNMKHHAVFEVNAFGDLLKNVDYDEKNTYETEVDSLNEFFSKKKKIRALYFDLDGTLIPQSMIERRDINQINPDASTHHVLSSLRDHYELVIISNGSSCNQKKKIKAAGLSRYFSSVHISDEENSRKPRKNIFLKALQTSGHLPSEVLFVGNDPLCDIKGAKSVGMKTCWISNGDIFPSAMGAPDYTINSLRELVEVLAR